MEVELLSKALVFLAEADAYVEDDTIFNKLYSNIYKRIMDMNPSEGIEWCISCGVWELLSKIQTFTNKDELLTFSLKLLSSVVSSEHGFKKALSSQFLQSIEEFVGIKTEDVPNTNGSATMDDGVSTPSSGVVSAVLGVINALLSHDAGRTWVTCSNVADRVVVSNLSHGSIFVQRDAIKAMAQLLLYSDSALCISLMASLEKVDLKHRLPVYSAVLKQLENKSSQSAIEEQLGPHLITDSGVEAELIRALQLRLHWQLITMRLIPDIGSPEHNSEVTVGCLDSVLHSVLELLQHQLEHPRGVLSWTAVISMCCSLTTAIFKSEKTMSTSVCASVCGKILHFAYLLQAMPLLLTTSSADESLLQTRLMDALTDLSKVDQSTQSRPLLVQLQETASKLFQSHQPRSLVPVSSGQLMALIRPVEAVVKISAKKSIEDASENINSVVIPNGSNASMSNSDSAQNPTASSSSNNSASTSSNLISVNIAVSSNSSALTSDDGIPPSTKTALPSNNSNSTSMNTDVPSNNTSATDDYNLFSPLDQVDELVMNVLISSLQKSVDNLASMDKKHQGCYMSLLSAILTNILDKLSKSQREEILDLVCTLVTTNWPTEQGGTAACAILKLFVSPYQDIVSHANIADVIEHLLCHGSWSVREAALNILFLLYEMIQKHIVALKDTRNPIVKEIMRDAIWRGVLGLLNSQESYEQLAAAALVVSAQNQLSREHVEASHSWAVLVCCGEDASSHPDEVRAMGWQLLSSQHLQPQSDLEVNSLFDCAIMACLPHAQLCSSAGTSELQLAALGYMTSHVQRALGDWRPSDVDELDHCEELRTAVLSLCADGTVSCASRCLLDSVDSVRRAARDLLHLLRRPLELSKLCDTEETALASDAISSTGDSAAVTTETPPTLDETVMEEVLDHSDLATLAQLVRPQSDVSVAMPLALFPPATPRNLSDVLKTELEAPSVADESELLSVLRDILLIEENHIGPTTAEPGPATQRTVDCY